MLGAEASKECGSVFDPLVTSLLVESAAGAFSSAPGRGLAGSGGGIGRVAEGASGISSGFCWAIAPPPSHKLIPTISSALVFIVIIVHSHNLLPNRAINEVFGAGKLTLPLCHSTLLRCILNLCHRRYPCSRPETRQLRKFSTPALFRCPFRLPGASNRNSLLQDRLARSRNKSRCTEPVSVLALGPACWL